MQAQKVGYGGLMVASLALAAATYRLTDDPRTFADLARDSLIRYPLLGVAVATFVTAWIAGWRRHDLLEDKPMSLWLIYGLFFGGFVLLSLAPLAVASALGKGEGWAGDLRTVCLIASMAVLIVKNRTVAKPARTGR